MPKRQAKRKPPGVASPSELSIQSSGMSASDFPFAGGSVMGRSREGGAGESRQVRPLEHGWQYVTPPYNFRELRRYYESNPWNKASVDAIVDAVVGYELGLKPSAELESAGGQMPQPDPAQKQLAIKFLRTAGDRYPLEDVLKQVQRDYENTGNAYIEVARERGVPKYLYYMPAETVRVHFDLTKYEQIRGGKRAFFFPFSLDNDDFSLNEVIHIHKPCPQSYYYGIPEHLAAIGAILGELRARDFNLDKFESQLIAPWAIIFGGQVSNATRRRVEEFFEKKMNKADWQKPLILGMDGANLKVDEAIKFHRLSEEIKDMSFTAFRKMNRDEILAVRRVPPSRIAFFDNPRYQTSPEQGEQFRDEVVLPRQRMLEFHMNRLLLAIGVTDWELKLPVMDMTAAREEASVASVMVASQSCKRNEIRKKLRLEPLSPEEGGEEIIKSGSGAGAPMPPAGEPGEPGAPEGFNALLQGLGPQRAAQPVQKSADDSHLTGVLRRLETRLAKIVRDI